MKLVDKIIEKILGEKPNKDGIVLMPIAKKQLDNKVIGNGLKNTYSFIHNSDFTPEVKNEMFSYLQKKY